MKNRLMKRFVSTALLTLCVMAAPFTSLAGTQQAHYQVFLVDSAGTPVNAPVAVTVSFYDAAEGGTPAWSETQTVTPDSGLCIVSLGKVNPFNLTFNQPYHLGVKVETEPESTPRLAVPSPGSFSRAGAKINDRQLNVKYEWLDIDVQ